MPDLSNIAISLLSFYIIRYFFNAANRFVSFVAVNPKKKLSDKEENEKSEMWGSLLHSPDSLKFQKY